MYYIFHKSTTIQNKELLQTSWSKKWSNLDWISNLTIRRTETSTMQFGIMPIKGYLLSTRLCMPWNEKCSTSYQVSSSFNPDTDSCLLWKKAQRLRHVRYLYCHKKNLPTWIPLLEKCCRHSRQRVSFLQNMIFQQMLEKKSLYLLPGRHSREKVWDWRKVEVHLGEVQEQLCQCNW